MQLRLKTLALGLSALQISITASPIEGGLVQSPMNYTPTVAESPITPIQKRDDLNVMVSPMTPALSAKNSTPETPVDVYGGKNLAWSGSDTPAVANPQAAPEVYRRSEEVVENNAPNQRLDSHGGPVVATGGPVFQKRYFTVNQQESEVHVESSSVPTVKSETSSSPEVHRRGEEAVENNAPNQRLEARGGGGMNKMLPMMMMNQNNNAYPCPQHYPYPMQNCNTCAGGVGGPVGPGKFMFRKRHLNMKNKRSNANLEALDEAKGSEGSDNNANRNRQPFGNRIARAFRKRHFSK